MSCIVLKLKTRPLSDLVKFSTRLCQLQSRQIMTSYFLKSEVRDEKVKDNEKETILDLNSKKHLIGIRKLKQMTSFKDSVLPDDLAELRLKFPDFLPVNDIKLRHKLFEYIQRRDMIKRRTVIDIPEFYVGSILAVTVSDPNSVGKVSRFLGICIQREAQGLRSNFTLRNYMDHQGVEIRYDMYNPTIRSIEVIKLEKRIDPHLVYLRDAEPEFSTFPLDMQAEQHPEGEPVPVNPLRVKMRPYPWTRRWEVDFPKIRGWEKLENVRDWGYYRTRPLHDPILKFDLMKDYREHIKEEDQLDIWNQVNEHLKDTAAIRKQEKRRKLLGKTEKT